MFLDLAKAFDTVGRGQLIRKMELIGLDNNSLRWFSIFLKDRTQTANIRGTKSESVKVNFGVIQDSTRALYFFNICK